MAYVTQQDLEARIGEATTRICWDDDRDGFADGPKLASAIAQADAKVNAKLARLRITVPITQTPVPALVKEASLLFLVAYTYMRRPEYVRQHGARPLEEANAFLEDIAEAKSFLNDLQEQPRPPTVGGLVMDPDPARLVVTDIFGNNNSGDY